MDGDEGAGAPGSKILRVWKERGRETVPASRSHEG